MSKRALLTGITGQDGSYLAEFLLARGYEVHGLIRRSSSFHTQRIDHLYRDPHEPNVRLHLHYGDLTDVLSLRRALDAAQPDEVYHLGAQSHVRVSFDMPEFTTDTVMLGTTHLLEAIHQSGLRPRYYQAGSSEMYGSAPAPQREDTPFRPQSPYAAAKVGAHAMAAVYRDAYDLFVCNAILFNHESPRRGRTFVTRKITRAVAEIVAGHTAELYLGNLDAVRDWGYAPEYVEAMWMMLQRDTPADFVIATGEGHTVREFLELAFALVGRRAADHLRYDPVYERPAEVPELIGDPSHAERVLGWRARTRFRELVELMVAADLRAAGLDPEREMVPLAEIPA